MVQAPPPSAVALPTWVAPANSVTFAPASALPLKDGAVVLVMLSLFDVPMSEAAAMSGVPGAVGAALSIVTETSADFTLLLPAVSVAMAETRWIPALISASVIDQLPDPSATPEPMIVSPSNRVIAALASAVPVKVGVWSLVRLSLSEAPVSDAAA